MRIIFDLDGTLVDSAPLIADIVNEMLAERGADKLVTPSDAREYLTQGGAQLVAALIGDDPADLASFRSRYSVRPTPADCLYPGVAEGLAALSRMGARMAICSNKPQLLCEKIVADLDLSHHFAAIVGSVDGVPLKPAPDLALAALAELDAAPEDCVYVGDSEVDRKTAHSVGVSFVVMTYGYAEQGFVFDGLAKFDRFAEFVQFVSEQSPASQRVA